MTTTEAIRLLEELQNAVRNTEYEESEELLIQLTNQYENINSFESAKVQRYSVARFRSKVSNKGQAQFNQFMQAVVETEIQRASVLSETQGFVRGANVDGETLGERIDTLRNEEEDLLQKQKDASSIKIDQKLPSIIVVSQLDITASPLPKGRDAELVTTIQNVGDEPAREVNIAIEKPAGLSISPQQVTFSELSDERTIRSTITGQNGGEYTVNAEVTSTDDSGFEATTVIVITKKSATNSATTLVDSLQNRVESLDISDGKKNALLKKLVNSERKLEQALSSIEKEQSVKADRQLNTARNILGAFLNQVSALGKNPNSSLNKRERVFLETRAEDAVEQISIGIDAQI